MPIYLQVLDFSVLQAGLRLAVGAVAAGVVVKVLGHYIYSNLVVHILLIVAFSLYSTLNLVSSEWRPFVYLSLGTLDLALRW